MSSCGLWRGNSEAARDRSIFAYIEKRGPRQEAGSLNFSSLQEMGPGSSQMHSERTRGNGHYLNCSKTHSNYKEKKGGEALEKVAGRGCGMSLLKRWHKSQWTGSQAT